MAPALLVARYAKRGPVRATRAVRLVLQDADRPLSRDEIVTAAKRWRPTIEAADVDRVLDRLLSTGEVVVRGQLQEARYALNGAFGWGLDPEVGR